MKVLIANRGEIARRIARTCREMGLETVAVFSDADRDAPFVREADHAVRIGPAPSGESYLKIEAILDAAKHTGAWGVHPGYGFLAENAAFAEACEQARLVFVGPPAAAIRKMGTKREAKAIAIEAGVPVVPGADGGDQKPETITRQALQIGFPMLLKASAGGGGKGMRVVRSEAELPEAIAAARREAEGAFGDSTLVLERYLDEPHHVEIQVLGDHHGNLMHLHERECSVQRRHQKIVEESPSPVLTPELRAKMGAAAVAVSKAVGYTNAGTVEFLVDRTGAFYFLEMNTRLQVEHPVTEMITGLDLVRLQLMVAMGERLGFTQQDVGQRGHAIEVRLYAEDADNGFLPQSGRIVDWVSPVGPELRIDSGVETGSDVGIHYDPMLAKIIAHARSREECIGRLRRGLRQLSVQGIITNRDYLLRALGHPAFAEGKYDTGFCDRYATELSPPALAPETLWLAAAGAALAGHEERRAAQTLLPDFEPGFRSNFFAAQDVRYRVGDRDVDVRYRNLGKGAFEVDVDGTKQSVTHVRFTAPDLELFVASTVRHRLRVVSDGDRHYVSWPDAQVSLVEQPRFPEHGAAAESGALTAPMPGKIVMVHVEVGTSVVTGAPLVTLEAMKMEHVVRAGADGVVKEVRVAPGDQVQSAHVLIVMAD